MPEFSPDGFEWRSIEGFPGYCVDLEGTIWSNRSGKWMAIRGQRTSNGNLRVVLKHVNGPCNRSVPDLLCMNFFGFKPSELDMHCRGRLKPGGAGPLHYKWNGDATGVATKRHRARALYELGACEQCGLPATDRHHKDGNTGHNEPSNIGILCRRCHMAEDGRLERFRAMAKSKKGCRIPDKACVRCHAMVHVTRKGRCNNCSMYLYKTGRERPLELFAGATI
jgi:hypothetical protein